MNGEERQHLLYLVGNFSAIRNVSLKNESEIPLNPLHCYGDGDKFCAVSFWEVEFPVDQLPDSFVEPTPCLFRIEPEELTARGEMERVFWSCEGRAADDAGLTIYLHKGC